MQMTPAPFWLMIVSVATAVFPVCRSPMMSSRCPRPIGIIASMAFRPVWSGSFTGCRLTMPGALISTRRKSFVSMGPRPSTGCPRALTTRPTMASPHGTSTMRPVRRTVSPSLISWSSPRRTTPTLSSSRLSTMPRTSPGNSRSSPAIAFSRPWTRAIPSSTERTTPVSATSMRFSYPLIWLFRISVISSARMLMAAFSPLLQVFADLVDLRAHAAVVHGGTHPHDHAPEHRGIHGLLQHDLLPRPPLEDRLEEVFLRAGQGHRDHDLDPLDPLELLHHAAQRDEDLGQYVHPPLLDQQGEERLRRREEAGLRQGPVEGRVLVLAADVVGLQHLPQRGRPVEGLPELLDLREHPAKLPLLLPDVEQRARVPPGQASSDHRTIPSIFWMFSRTSRSWSSGVNVLRTSSSAARADSSDASRRSSSRAFLISCWPVNSAWARMPAISAA